MFQTPILFLIFNRPDTTLKVFKKIRECKPKKLFIASDGPRPDKKAEREKCEQARAIATNIDWSCEVRTLFREENLGCGRSVSSAIHWFFELVEEGIILEDDCLPDITFFQFISELLKLYRNDTRVMMISGFNHFKKWKEQKDYHFVYYGGVWGWGTWRRSWHLYDYDIKFFKHENIKEIIKNVLRQDDIYIDYRLNVLKQVYQKTIDTWDYQWGLCRIINSGLCIIPSKNLVSNIGFGQEATHTKDKTSLLNNSPLFSYTFPLKENLFVVPDREYDNSFMAFQSSRENKISNNYFYKIIKGLYEKFIK